MLRWVFGAGACATLALAPLASAAQGEGAAEETAVVEVAADGEVENPLQARPLGDPGQWITYDDYPREALRDQVSGAAGVRLDLDEQGVPTGCSITATSGSEALDAASCAVLMKRARFHPVLDSAGIAVPGVFETRVRWLTSDPAPDPDATTPQPIDMSLWVSAPNLQYDPDAKGTRAVTYDLEVDETGSVRSCAISESSGDKRYDRSVCRQLTINAEFDVTSSGPGHFTGNYAIPEEVVGIFLAVGGSNPDAKNYGIRLFIEEDGSVSACRWLGRNPPALDPWPICKDKTWVDQRDTSGELVRGETVLGISQRRLDELAIPSDDPRSPANRALAMVFLDDGSVSDCRWTGPNPPALDPLLACKYVALRMKRNAALAALMRGAQSVGLDEHEVATLMAAQGGARVVD